MGFSISYFPKRIQFKQPAGTSRGVLTERLIYYIVVRDNDDSNRWGVGECAPLPGLSVECNYANEIEDVMRQSAEAVMRDGGLTEVMYERLRPYPSLLFAFETAMRQYQSGSLTLWNTPFTRGEEGISINGLVWMGNLEEMKTRAGAKLKEGFRCIKFKIGALNFAKEMEMIAGIRSLYSPEELEIRVDANGAFAPDEAMEKLNILSQFHIHSIEQPIRAGQWDVLRELCAKSPIPIALDEELIANYEKEKKRALLDVVRPQYIVLKPSLHGGIRGSEEWINLAKERGIGYWVTSALESNVGLNAIAQWSSTLNISMPQGLGTGCLFTENYELPIEIRGSRLWYRSGKLADFLQERLKFELKWDMPCPTMELQTSGSTGTPKRIEALKTSMVKSAENTCKALNLQSGSTALLAMPVKYVAGMMMVVRARVQQLRLLCVPPSAHPLADLEENVCIDFAALTPMQVHATLEAGGKELERLKAVRCLIIGGGFISEALEQTLQQFPYEVWATYGMTETLSHIALRRVSGSNHTLWYTPLEGVAIRKAENDVLAIRAEGLFEGELVTHDVVEINSQGDFSILGRLDNVINSGGIKIQIEAVEAGLEHNLNGTFAITSVPDEKFGEAVALLVTHREKRTVKQLQDLCHSLLPRYWVPYYIFWVDDIPLTKTGKIDRSKAKALALQTIKV